MLDQSLRVSVANLMVRINLPGDHIHQFFCALAAEMIGICIKYFTSLVGCASASSAAAKDTVWEDRHKPLIVAEFPGDSKNDFVAL